MYPRGGRNKLSDGDTPAAGGKKRRVWWAVIASSFLALHVQTSLAAISQQNDDVGLDRFADDEKHARRCDGRDWPLLRLQRPLCC